MNDYNQMDMVGHDHIQWYIYFAAAYIICVFYFLSQIFTYCSQSHIPVMYFAEIMHTVFCADGYEIFCVIIIVPICAR